MQLAGSPTQTCWAGAASCCDLKRQGALLELNCGAEPPSFLGSFGGRLLGSGLPERARAAEALLPVLHHPIPSRPVPSRPVPWHPSSSCCAYTVSWWECVGRLFRRLGWQSRRRSLSYTQPWFGLPPAKPPVAHAAS